MRITQVSAYYDPFSGGSENYCRQLSRRLVERGHEVTVLTSRIDNASKEVEDVDGVTVRRKWCGGVAWGVNPVSIVLKDLLQTDADVVHAHSYIFLTSLQAAFARRLRRTPLLLHLHGGLDARAKSEDFPTRMKFLAKKHVYDPTLGRWISKSADAVASVCERDIEHARKIWDLDPARVHLVPNAVDTSEFDGAGPDSPRNVTFIGRLEPWKGIRTFLQVAKLIGREMPDVKFLIAGDGSLRHDLEKTFSNGNVKFLGQVSHRDIPSVLDETAVLVLPSYMEGLPTVCLEAFASGVPVVASNVGGTPEIVRDLETGFLFEAGDASSCAKETLRILSDRTLGATMGRNGRKLVETRYSWESVVHRIEMIYESMVSR